MKKEKKDYLKESFIYNASLASKELFHSNIWAWIFENKELGYLFFNALFDKSITKEDGITVEREKKKME